MLLLGSLKRNGRETSTCDIYIDFDNSQSFVQLEVTIQERTYMLCSFAYR